MSRTLLAVLVVVGCTEATDERPPPPAPTRGPSSDCEVGSLDFGEVEVGSVRTMDLPISCSHAATVSVSGGDLDPVFTVAETSSPSPLDADGSLLVPVTFAPDAEGAFEGPVHVTIQDGPMLVGTVSGVGVAPAGTTLEFDLVVVEDRTVPGTGGTSGIDLDWLGLRKADGRVLSPILIELATGPGDCSTTFGQPVDLGDVDAEPACSPDDGSGVPTFTSFGGEGGYAAFAFGVPFQSGDVLIISECGLDGDEAYDVVVETTDGERVRVASSLSGAEEIGMPYLEEL